MEYFDEVLQQPRYWEISLRNIEKKVIEKITPKIELEEGEICETCFGEEEHKEIYDDYLEIEREIFSFNSIYV